MKNLKKVFIITGESSGDKHASGVARELMALNPDVKIEAVGGENLKRVGVKLFQTKKDGCNGAYAKSCY